MRTRSRSLLSAMIKREPSSARPALSVHSPRRRLRVPHGPERPASGVASQFGRFGAVGVANTLLDYVLFISLTKLLGLPLDWVWTAKVASGSVAMVNSFYWNRTWVFKTSTRRSGETVRFLITTLTGVYVIQALLTHLFASIYPGLGEAAFRLAEWSGL